MEVGHRPVHESYTDVLIVGAGPSGLMAAQALARLGVHTRIIDRREKGALYGNADGFLPRTLEIWKSYGLTDELFRSNSSQMHGMVLCEQTDSGLQRGIPDNVFTVASRYPLMVGCSIQTTEGILRRSAEAHGVSVEQPVHPVDIEVMEQSECSFPVAVTVEPLPTSDANTSANVPHAAVKVHAKYVLAADGSYSWVRRALNIPMNGNETEYVWGVVDANFVTDFPDWRFICQIQSSTGAVLYIPRENGLGRFYVQLVAEKFERDSRGRIDKSKATPDIVREYVRQGVVKALHPYNIRFTCIVWSTIFAVQRKLASQFSYQNRVFIMGDAGHTHSPFAGQGANASMCDAHNLAWKLAHVLRGWAKPSILDTYALERRKFAEGLIAFDEKWAALSNGIHVQDASTIWTERNFYGSGMGLCYTSTLSHLGNKFQNTTHITVGMCLPSGAVLRLGDWLPMDIQDLAPSDGLFKLIIFAGDVQLPTNAKHLTEFADALQEQLQQHRTQMLAMFTILNAQKERFRWTDVPQSLQDWDRVLVDCPPMPNSSHGALYESLGIGADGIAVLVRPDGYVSMVAGVSKEGGSDVARFLTAI